MALDEHSKWRTLSLCGNHQCVGAPDNSSKSFLGDAAAVLALSAGGTDIATPSASVASMAWRLTRRAVKF